MTFLCLPVSSRPRENIGTAVTRACKEISVSHPEYEFMAVVPRIYTYFGTSPERFETTEVDLLFKFDEQKKGVSHGRSTENR